MPIPSRASPGCSFPPASRTRRRARPSRSSSPGGWPTGSSSPHRSTTRRCRRPWSRSSRRRWRRSGPEGPSHGPRRSPLLSRGPRRTGPGAPPETARRSGVSCPLARLRALGHRHRGHHRRRAAAALGAGVGLLTAGILLAVMIVPFIVSVSREVLLAVPQTQRDAALALGATRWETVRDVVVPYARSGILGSVFLALARALGETMAVTMVIGNRPELAASLFAPAYTMAAVLANEFTEATDEVYLAALVEIALVLFAITLAINALARLLIASVRAAPGAQRP